MCQNIRIQPDVLPRITDIHAVSQHCIGRPSSSQRASLGASVDPARHPADDLDPVFYQLFRKPSRTFFPIGSARPRPDDRSRRFLVFGKMSLSIQCIRFIGNTRQPGRICFLKREAHPDSAVCHPSPFFFRISLFLLLHNRIAVCLI